MLQFIYLIVGRNYRPTGSGRNLADENSPPASAAVEHDIVHGEISKIS